LQRAQLKEKQGDLGGAIADYDQLIEQYPKVGAYYFGRARLKLKKSHYDGAIADCNNALTLLRDTVVRPQAYSTRGEVREAKGDFAGAVADYQMALEIIPNAPVFKNKLKHAQAAAARKQP
jgi:tetratricopeptide (TPR) repeat protein